MPSLKPAELTPQEQKFVSLIATEGASISQAAKKVGISRASGYLWEKRPHIAAAIQASLRHNRTAIQLRATKLLDKAFETLENALDDRSATPTMVTAAKLIIQHAAGVEVSEERGNIINVMVSTQLGSDLVERQRRLNSQSENVIEGGFTVIPQ